MLNATVSHEMMTPLGCIISFADNLSESLRADLPKFEKARTIFKTAKLLRMNLKDLLDRSLLENGRLEPAFEPYCLSDLI